MNPITINVSLYGDIAQLVSGQSVYNADTTLPQPTSVKDLMGYLNIPLEKQGYTFINAILCDMPGLGTSHAEILQDGDHIGIFSKLYVWPFQYRNGARMSEALRKTLMARGAMHHTY
ncbi:MAG: hypothetical protein ROW52_09410 [Anaerolineaceae bacterium]|jgi:hypothetical protein